MQSRTVDDCRHTFKELVDTEFPTLLERLERRIDSAWPMKEFAERGVGVARLCKKLDIDADFPGCYVLIENRRPQYVGISRRVINRLQQHVKGRTHFDASLAYLMAHRAMPGEGARAARMGQDAFRRLFDEKRAYLASLHCAFVDIENALVRYVFETFCAVHFNTFEWNTFETH